MITIDSNYYIDEINEKDKIDFCKYLNDIDIYKNTLAIPNPYTEKDAEFWIKRQKELSEKNNNEPKNFVIRNKTGNLIGGIGVVELKISHKAEIGYWLAKPFWNKGIMTNAVKVFCDYLFNKYDLVRICAHVMGHNEASAKVLEKACFKREGILRKHILKDGQYIDAIYYGLIK